MECLQNRTAIVTGSSRGIGAEIALKLAKKGAAVVVNYRQKVRRAVSVVQSIEEAGGQAVAVGGDLTSPEDIRVLAAAAIHHFGSLDILVLNASGGMETGKPHDYALKLNRDAQIDMLDAAAPLMPAGSRVIFVTSHQAHFINSVPTTADYELVARSKRAGEDALRERIPALAELGITLAIVSGDVIEGTMMTTLLERATPGAIQARRKLAGKLYSVEEFAAAVADMATAEIESGHIEFVGGARHFCR